MEGDENAYEVNLARENWIAALEEAKLYYHDSQEYDRAIDTHLLIEKVESNINDTQR